MKPGDLVTIRKWKLATDALITTWGNVSHRVPITYIDVYKRVDGEIYINPWKWEHGDVGVLLEGRDDQQEMVQVLHGGRVGWVKEEFLRVISEAG